MTAKTTKNNLPKWASGRVSFILTPKHDRMLTALIGRIKQDDPRATRTTVMEIAIERLYEQYDLETYGN